MTQQYFLNKDNTWWDCKLPKKATGNAEILMLGGVRPNEDIYDYLTDAVTQGYETTIIAKDGAHTIRTVEEIKLFFDVCNLIYDTKATH